MHDGFFENLAEVIAHYKSGGKNHPHKNDLIQPLNLTLEEQSDLKHFLESLTDDFFVENPIFQ